MNKNKQIYNLKEYCHINTNKDDDCFVGIKIDSNGPRVCFPLGYHLSNSNKELRNEINNLIRILYEFTSQKEKLIDVNNSQLSESVKFPINSYLTVLNYYFNHGGNYYLETENIYKIGAKGKINWGRTIKKQIALVQSTNDKKNLIYSNFIIKNTKVNDNNLIAKINRYCVYESFVKLGWLFSSYLPIKPSYNLNIKHSIIILNDKLSNTFKDEDRTLFIAMKNILSFIDNNSNNKTIYFGTYTFETVWEKMIDYMFGIKNKNDFFPKTKWLLKKDGKKYFRPLQPDSIMIYKNKYYVLDSKYYKYGVTGNYYDLPNSSSINKQITYAQYIKKQNKLDDDAIYNAFIMPFDNENNPFDIKSITGNIGEAIAEWTNIEFKYERIQGILIDTKFVMNNYLNGEKSHIEDLVNIIELPFKIN